MIEILLALSFYALVLWWSVKRTRLSPNEFLIADRQLGYWGVILSLLATTVGGGILLAAGAYIYEFGISALWFFVGKVLGLVLLGIFMAQQKARYTKGEYLNLTDYFTDHHGRVTGRVIALILAYCMLGGLMMNAVGGAKIISLVSGLSYTLALAIFLGVVLFYTLVGGFVNIVRTDKLQAGLFMLVFAIFLIPLSANWSQVDPAQWRWDGIGTQNIFSFLIAGLLLPFAQTESWQRFYASHHANSLRKILGGFMLAYLLFGALLCLVLMLIRAQLPGLDPDLAIAEGVVQLFPPALVALGVVAFLAIIMSTIDSVLFALTGIIAKDGYNHARKKTPQQVKRAMQVSLVVVTIVLLISSLAWPNVLEIAIYFTALVLCVSVAVLTSWFSGQRASSLTLIGGVVGGFVGTHVALIWLPLAPDIIAYVFVSVLGGSLLGSTINAGLKKFKR